jgi:hypothetical protein
MCDVGQPAEASNIPTEEGENRPINQHTVNVFHDPGGSVHACLSCNTSGCMVGCNSVQSTCLPNDLVEGSFCLGCCKIEEPPENTRAVKQLVTTGSGTPDKCLGTCSFTYKTPSKGPPYDVRSAQKWC